MLLVAASRSHAPFRHIKNSHAHTILFHRSHNKTRIKPKIHLVETRRREKQKNAHESSERSYIVKWGKNRFTMRHRSTWANALIAHSENEAQLCFLNYTFKISWRRKKPRTSSETLSSNRQFSVYVHVPNRFKWCERKVQAHSDDDDDDGNLSLSLS